jgi:hypothetical protein
MKLLKEFLVKKAWCYCLFGLVLGGSVFGAENKVLFIGNSFTYGAGGTQSVPDIFDALANGAGQEDPLTVMRAVGGQDYEYHHTNSITGYLDQEQWTHVILQNYSTEPTHVGSISDHMEYGALLYGDVMANNPDTQVYLYMTWSRAEASSMISGTSTSSTFATTDEMLDELRTNYYALAETLSNANLDRLPVLVNPVGDAWDLAGGHLATSDPDFMSLHYSDNYHGNNYGYYLSACVHYASIYKSSPIGLHLKDAVIALDLSISDEDAEFLETVAWDTVQPQLLAGEELTLTTQPMSASVDENGSVSFSVEVDRRRPITIQWYEDETPISGATALTYTKDLVSLSEDGMAISVVIDDGVMSVTSEEAILTVTPDETAPVVESFEAIDFNSLSLSFNEVMAASEAIILENYEVAYHGQLLRPSSVSLSSDGKLITLTFDESLVGNVVVRLSELITDLAGNSLADVERLQVYTYRRASDATIYIDFGSRSTVSSEDTWNQVSINSTIQNAVGNGTGTPHVYFSDLLDASGSSTEIEFSMSDAYAGTNTDGTTEGPYPSGATSDSLFGCSTTWGGYTENGQTVFHFSNLDPLASYDFSFFASRMEATDNRETRYSVQGANSGIVDLNVSSNTATVAEIIDMKPDSDGQITLTISAGPENDNSYVFYYLGALELSVRSAVEPNVYPPVQLGTSVIVDWSGEGALAWTDDLNLSWQVVSPEPSAPFQDMTAEGGSRFYLLNY